MLLHPSRKMLGCLVFASFLFPSGCSAPSQPVALSPHADSTHGASAATYVTLPIDETASEYEVVQWLRTGGVHVERDLNGDDRVFDSPACRAILVRYRRMLRVQLDLIAQNIANKDSVYDAQGATAPYRRKYIIADADGTFKIADDPSPFIVRHEPGNTAADSNGDVHYPNVDMSLEQVNAIEVSRSYRMVTSMLMRFDPTFVDVFGGPP